MPIDPDRLLALKLPDVEQVYTEKDVMLYALGVGLGQQSTDAAQLAFVYEKSLKVLPTFATVLGFSPYLLRDFDSGIDFVKTVHGEEHIVLHRQIPPSGHIVARNNILDVIDKGTGKGALVVMERIIHDKTSGEPIATVTQTVFCRGDGGFGGAPRQTPPAHAIPDRAPDEICDLATRPETALIYRLSGDTNPLHADPDVAKASGFPQPILQGLGTFGVAGHAILRTICEYDPSRVIMMSGRFSAPVFPGETIRTEIWRDGDVVSYRARVAKRNVIAINNGRAEIRSA